MPILHLVEARLAGEVTRVKEVLTLLPQITECGWCRNPFLPAEIIYLMAVSGVKGLPTSKEARPRYHLCATCANLDLSVKTVLP